MRTTILSVALLSAAFLTPVVKADLKEAVARLLDMHRVAAQVKVTVELPVGSEDEIVYNVGIASQPSMTTDSLLPVSYLIDWELPGVGAHGFSAYFDGNFYRFRDGSRMEEYHVDVNPEPFISSTPIQSHTQFYETVPVAVGQELSDMLADSTYTLHWVSDTLFRGDRVSALLATRAVQGYEAANLKYLFDGSTMRPVYIEKEMSPGSISEQTLTYDYTYPHTVSTVPQTEGELSSRYADAFSLYRDDTFGLVSLKGKPVPPLALSTIDGQRFNRQRGETAGSREIIVFVDEEISSTPDVVREVRRGANSLPMNVDIVWVFLSNRTDDIREVVGNPGWGETVLISGRNAVKDFGVAAAPSLVFVNSDGIVKEVITAFNNNLRQSVIDIVGTE